jgi:hypothetical protein
MGDLLSARATKRMLFASVLPFALITESIQALGDSQWGSGKNLYDKVCRIIHCQSRWFHADMNMVFRPIN